MKTIILMLKGVLIGISILIPGVSGGTMAIILGVYDEMIHAVSSFFQSKRQNALLLLKIGTGGLIGIVLFSKLISYMLDKWKYPMVFLFIGVICGGLPVLLKKTKTAKSRNLDLLYSIAGFLLVIAMTRQPDTVVNLATQTGVLNFLFLVFAGFIIAIALILPGISTSFMLLTLGLYDVTLEAITNFNIAFLIPVIIGIVIGTISTTRLLEFLMQRYPRKTYLLILGFVLGSVLQIIPGLPKGMDILYCILTFASGLIAIQFMSKYTSENV
ncbi:MAG: DUF368 domain-containing protein [Bacillota bacterium]|nr:DUF368 domain-containing protein [Bacillota bacterium]